MISIIIPTFNRDALLGATLDSIRAQSYKDWECIVIDDGSWDYTEELMQFYCDYDSRILYFERPKERKKGANACRNYGFELSKGKKIIWFDSDDLMLRDFLKGSINFFKYKSDLDLVICNYKIFGDLPTKILHTQYNQIQNLTLDYFTGKINFGSWALLWNRRVVEKFKFDERLSRAQELEFHFQVFSSRQIKWQLIEEPMVLVRRHQNSITGQYNRGLLENIQSELKVRRKIIAFLNNSGVEKQVLIEALEIYLIGFRRFIKHGSIGLVKRELERLKKILKFNKKWTLWKSKLLLLAMFSKTGRGQYGLKIHLFQLKNYLN